MVRRRLALYFWDETREYLITVARRVGDEAAQTPQRAIAELVKGPEVGPLVPFFAAGTAILEFAVSGSQANLALAMPNDVTQLDVQTIDAIRWTMTEFDEIERVALTVNGQNVDAEGNFVDTAIALDRPASINSHISASGQPILLHFGYAPDPSLLVPVTHYIDTEVEGTGGDARLVQTVEQLLLGPPAGSNLVSTIPPNVDLLDAHMDGVVANVNFSEDLVIALPPERGQRAPRTQSRDCYNHVATRRLRWGD